MLSPRQTLEHAKVPTWQIMLLAMSCGLIVANLYYAQPLIAPISASLGLSAGAAGLIVTMTQIGYAIGLLFVVPIGDLMESRRLILAIMSVGTLALASAALSTNAWQFLGSALFIGLGSVAVQVLVPYAAHLAPEAIRGRVVGTVVSGVMFGIMLARPVASVIADLLAWNAVFAIAAVIMVALAILLWVALPSRRPDSGLHYGALLASMVGLARHTPILRRRAIYHACLFGAFSVFWTTTPLLLAERFHLSQSGIALFALAGVAGAIAAPIAGRVADRGWSKPATGFAMLAVIAAFLASLLDRSGSKGALILLTASAILLDFGVTANLVLGQRAIFTLGAEFRARLNGIYMATFFGGGALGSSLGAWIYAQGGWPATVALGVAMPTLALLYFCTERSTNE